MNIKKNDNDIEWSRSMLQRQKTMIKIKLLKLMIIIELILILFLLFGCATPQYIPSAQIKPVYPHMRECPNLPQATQATYWQIVNVDVPAMYYQCKADHDAVKMWIDKQIKKE